MCALTLWTEFPLLRDFSRWRVFLQGGIFSPGSSFVLGDIFLGEVFSRWRDFSLLSLSSCRNFSCSFFFGGGVVLIGGVSHWRDFFPGGWGVLARRVWSLAPVKQEPYISTFASFQMPATSSRTRAITFQFRASFRKQKQHQCKTRSKNKIRTEKQKR